MSLNHLNLDMNLKATLQDDPKLQRELRLAFLESARLYLQLMRNCNEAEQIQQAAHKLHNLSAGFGASNIYHLTEKYIKSNCCDHNLLKRIAFSLDRLDGIID